MKLPTATVLDKSVGPNQDDTCETGILATEETKLNTQPGPTVKKHYPHESQLTKGAVRKMASFPVMG